LEQRASHQANHIGRRAKYRRTKPFRGFGDPIPLRQQGPEIELCAEISPLRRAAIPPMRRGQIGRDLPALLETWQDALRAHLARFKRYPVRALRRGEQGVTMVRFAMNHAGTVLSAVVVRSSGHDDLDQEALAWIQRAQPLPRPPPEVATDPIGLVVPLRFELR
jgi:periplasmic protein TonB